MKLTIFRRKLRRFHPAAFSVEFVICTTEDIEKREILIINRITPMTVSSTLIKSLLFQYKGKTSLFHYLFNWRHVRILLGAYVTL